MEDKLGHTFPWQSVDPVWNQGEIKIEVYFRKYLNLFLEYLLGCELILEHVFEIGDARWVNFLVFTWYKQTGQKYELPLIKILDKSPLLFDKIIEERHAVLNGASSKFKGESTLSYDPLKQMLPHLSLIPHQFVLDYPLSQQ